MSKVAPVSSEFVKQQRREYALYALSTKVLPSFADGLIKGARRNLWQARDGKTYKTETLAGNTMSLHPHSESSGIINNLTGAYVNNVPLFTGYGAFGTRITPDGFGAPRYTSVSISEFAKDAMLVDLNLVPMIPNYDGTMQEPKHFLPLVPIGLINAIGGISLGYSTRILPRSLEDIINVQLSVLADPNKEVDPPIPHNTRINSKAVKSYATDKGNTYVFEGEVQIVNSSEFIITSLPMGLEHASVIKYLDGLWDDGTIVSYTDNSAKNIHITVKLGRGKLKGKTEEDIIKEFKLIGKESEILRMLSVDETSVISNKSAAEIIAEFTEWRLEWYILRYQGLTAETNEELQKYLDIKCAIDNDAGMVARTSKTKTAFKQFLKGIGVVNIDYISNMSVFKFTQEEYNSNERRIKECEKKLIQYKKLIDSPKLLRQTYSKELEVILQNYRSGKYT